MVAPGTDYHGSMGHHRFAPRPELSPWVASLWVQQGPAVEAPPTTVVPHGQVELIVSFGDPFVHLEGGRVTTVPTVAALGQRTRPLLAAATGATGLVIAGLRPWAGEMLLSEWAADLVDRMLDLGELLGASRVARLAERVAGAALPGERARAVEDFLAGLVRRQDVDAVALQGSRRLIERRGVLSVDALAGELGVSGRHLRRRFVRSVGMGPKRFGRLVRAQEALAGLRAGHTWSEVALRGAYVDQAHLTRELKAFTGRTPSALRETRPETPLMRSFNRSEALSPYTTVYI